MINIVSSYISNDKQQLSSIDKNKLEGHSDINDVVISIDNVKDKQTYLDFTFSDISIDKLTNTCNEILDGDKSSWPCSEEDKNDYDDICVSMLILLNSYSKIIIPE